MMTRQTEPKARYALPPIDDAEDADDRASLVARLATRLRLGTRHGNRDISGEPAAPDRDLASFARRQVVSQGPLEGVDLAAPVSITADAASGVVRLELARTTSGGGDAGGGGAGEGDASGLLSEIVARIGPALFADGRVVRIEVGLLAFDPSGDAAGLEGGQTEWVVARPGPEQPC